MTESYVEIRHNKWPIQRSLGLDTGTRDAMADIWRERWPVGTAKCGAREYGLTLDQARSVVAARASQTTIDQIIKAGGWPLLFAVGAKVLGRGADQYISELRAEHEEQAGRLSALLGGWNPMAADPDADHPMRAPSRSERARVERDHGSQRHG